MLWSVETLHSVLNVVNCLTKIRCKYNSWWDWNQLLYTLVSKLCHWLSKAQPCLITQINHNEGIVNPLVQIRIYLAFMFQENEINPYLFISKSGRVNTEPMNNETTFKVFIALNLWWNKLFICSSHPHFSLSPWFYSIPYERFIVIHHIVSSYGKCVLFDGIEIRSSITLVLSMANYCWKSAIIIYTLQCSIACWLQSSLSSTSRVFESGRR